METCPNVVEAKPEDEAIILMDNYYIMPTRSLLSNYLAVKRATGHLIERSYELPYKWYLITFKPFNKNYERDLDFYKNKCFDHCRKKVGTVKAYVMTREVDAAKVHVNMLVCTDRLLEPLLHEKQTNRYFIYCQECKNRHDAYEYIIKESHTRMFYKHKDIIWYG